MPVLVLSTLKEYHSDHKITPWATNTYIINTKHHRKWQQTLRPNQYF